MQPNENEAANPGGPVEIEYIVRKKRRTPLARLSWLLFILVWVLILFMPFALLTLASRGQITISHSGDVPDKHEHPLLQARLISEIDYRGLVITRSTIDRIDTGNLCIQTHVSYLLWQGEGEAASFCDCYNREEGADAWSFVSSEIGSCP